MEVSPAVRSDNGTNQWFIERIFPAVADIVLEGGCLALAEEEREKGSTGNWKLRSAVSRKVGRETLEWGKKKCMRANRLKMVETDGPSMNRAENHA